MLNNEIQTIRLIMFIENIPMKIGEIICHGGLGP